MILIVSGPGGVGKGTLVDRLLERDPRLWLSRSWTTREPRPGESPDAYHFVSRQQFMDRVAAGGFLEWVEFLDYLQGSPVPEPPEGSDVVFEIDVEGGRQVRARYPEAVWVFVDVPSPEVQAERLRGRGDDPERIAQRVAKANEERVAAAELGVPVLVNDDLERAVAELEQIVRSARRGEG